MRVFYLISTDFLGLARVCGWPVALRWLWAVGTHLSECRSRQNLAPADAVFGDGPIRVRLGRRRAWLLGPCALTGVREIWVRNSYLKGTSITVADNARILDLGAGTGMFTFFALALAGNVRVTAVESESNRCRQLAEAAKLNEVTGRLAIINAFAGSGAPHTQIPQLNETQLADSLGPGPIDLLKCDIEGSELGLFGPASPLLVATRQIVMELHPHAGDVQPLIALIRSLGFQTELRQCGPTLMLTAIRAGKP